MKIVYFLSVFSLCIALYFSVQNNLPRVKKIAKQSLTAKNASLQHQAKELEQVPFSDLINLAKVQGGLDSAEQLLKKIDGGQFGDKNGSINQVEFWNYISKIMRQPEEKEITKAIKEFRDIDKNGDFEISLSELQKAQSKKVKSGSTHT